MMNIGRPEWLHVESNSLMSPDSILLPAGIPLGVGPDVDETEADRDLDRPPGGWGPLGARLTIRG